MPRVAAIQTAFVAGELSPRMRARIDLAQYNKGLSILENGIVQPHGPVEKRRGFQFVSEVANSNKFHRLIPFIFSDNQTYVLEFGDQSLRFYKDGGLIMDGAEPYQIATPYAASDLSHLAYAQSADVIWLVHPKYPIYQLSRYGHTNWRLTIFETEGGPWLPDNTSETTLQNSALTGRITLSAVPEDGPELVSNGEFSAATTSELVANPVFDVYPDSSWTWGTNWVHDTSTLTAKHITGSTATLSQTFTVIASATYQLAVTIVNRTNGSITLTLGGVTGSSISANGTTTQYITTTGTTGLDITPTTDFDGSIAAVSVKRLLPATEWQFGSGWWHNLVDLSAEHSGSDTISLSQTLPVESGKYYKVVFTISGRTTGSVTPKLGTNTGVPVSTNVVSTQIIQASGNNVALAFSPSGGFDGRIDSVSVRLYGQTRSVFTTAHVGAFFNLKHTEGRSISYVSQSNPARVSSTNHGLEDGDIIILKDMSPGVWAQLSGMQFAITKVDSDTFTIPYDTTSFTGFLSGSWIRKHGGVCRITEVIDGRTAYADVIIPFTSTQPTKRWAEGAWSAARGYPRAVTMFEGRLWFAGTAHQPQTVWASEVDNYGNFQVGAEDSDALSLTLSSDRLDVIEWLWSSRVLVAGTRAGIWRFMGAGLNDPLTPTSITARREIAQGTSWITPVSTSIASLAFDERNKRLIEIAYNFELDSYVANDISIMSSHILRSGGTALSMQTDPDTILWMVTNSGELVGCTYARSQEVVAWHRHVTKGVIESVAIVPGPAGDQVWVVVQRPGGRYVEYIDPEGQYLDSYLIYSGQATRTIFGLEHLNGETVIAYYNNTFELLAVSGGKVVLSGAATWAVIGLPYRLRMRTLPIEAGAQEGTAQGKIKRIHGVTLMLGETAYLQIGTPDWKQYLVPVKTLDSGDFFVHLPDRYTQAGQVELRQEAPYPATVLGLVFRLVTEDQ